MTGVKFSTREQFFSAMLDTIYFGDCLSVMEDFPDHSVNAAVSDLPGLRFRLHVRGCAAGGTPLRWRRQ
jgi:hypothetical protein